MKPNMNRKLMIGIVLLGGLLLLPGCGGGGGGGVTARVTGRVLEVGLKVPPNPQATVSAGGASAKTAVADGEFALNVPMGVTTLRIEATNRPTFEYPLPPLVAGQTYDLGYLYIGPEKVTVRGEVVDALTTQGLQGATVTLWGRQTTTDTLGRFTFLNMPYDPDGINQQPGLPDGVAEKDQYVPAEFTPEDPAINGVVTLSEPIQLAPLSGDQPPGAPGNVKGKVKLATVTPIGTRIEAYRPPTAITPLRTLFVTDGSGQFALWLAPGTYRLEFSQNQGAFRATRNPVVVQTLNQVIDLGEVELR